MRKGAKKTFKRRHGSLLDSAVAWYYIKEMGRVLHIKRKKRNIPLKNNGKGTLFIEQDKAITGKTFEFKQWKRIIS